MGAAFGLVQLKKLSDNLKKRTYNFNKHIQFFKQFSRYFMIPKQLEKSMTGWLAFPILIKENAEFWTIKIEPRGFLGQKGVESGQNLSKTI